MTHLLCHITVVTAISDLWLTVLQSSASNELDTNPNAACEFNRIQVILQFFKYFIISFNFVLFSFLIHFVPKLIVA